MTTQDDTISRKKQRSDYTQTPKDETMMNADADTTPQPPLNIQSSSISQTMLRKEDHRGQAGHAEAVGDAISIIRHVFMAVGLVCKSC